MFKVHDILECTAVFRLVHCRVIRLEVNWSTTLLGSIHVTPATSPESRRLMKTSRGIFYLYLPHIVKAEDC